MTRHHASCNEWIHSVNKSLNRVAQAKPIHQHKQANAPRNASCVSCSSEDVDMEQIGSLRTSYLRSRASIHHIEPNREQAWWREIFTAESGFFAAARLRRLLTL